MNIIQTNSGLLFVLFLFNYIFLALIFNSKNNKIYYSKIIKFLKYYLLYLIKKKVILFIITNVIVMFIVIGRMVLFTKNNPYKFAGENYISYFVMRAIIVILDTWSAVMILFLFLVTCYVFIFFKMQN